MAKPIYLDKTGLDELVKHIPQIVAGDNVTITPDPQKPNKITISNSFEYAEESDILAIFN